MRADVEFRNQQVAGSIPAGGSKSLICLSFLASSFICFEDFDQ
jgi:hypothetical protein